MKTKEQIEKQVEDDLAVLKQVCEIAEHHQKDKNYQDAEMYNQKFGEMLRGINALRWVLDLEPLNTSRTDKSSGNADR